MVSEEHEDNLLHEALLCLKGLCTTDLALQKLREIADVLFPALIGMLFDEEHKGPSEFTTRQIIINLLCMYIQVHSQTLTTNASFSVTHLSAAPKENLKPRARTILGYLADPKKPESDRPHNFLLEMHQLRPYRVWCREVVNVTKEVFWIFLHHLNVIALPKEEATSPTRAFSFEIGSYGSRHFPKARPPVPAAPYVGGVEWDATNYLSSHLDLLNGLIASLPTVEERNALRDELRASGWEKVMGTTLRTCKEKFYSAVHDGLRTWIAAAVEDDWVVADVRMGPKEEKISSPRKSPGKRKADEAPKLEAPKIGLDKLSLGLGGGGNGAGAELVAMPAGGIGVVDDWL